MAENSSLKVKLAKAEKSLRDSEQRFEIAQVCSTAYSVPCSGAEYCDQFVCLSLCVSICSRAYLWNRWTDLREICCTNPLWPWLSLIIIIIKFL